ncbi:galactitol-1-phosphate 5-dehydrogenase [Klugiella xanthotipulae]|uniref:L-iditol 2-dehydrogenase n=2 Tax=Klugiella xanthotipulae TaxID=244735 RepID=A0A543HXT3_9MICO|nr:L-iditol 2-dehydrogenase [Klugiella xanthotipulae]
MTAAVLYAPGEIRVENVAIPTIGSGDLLVKVAACGVCGSDIPRMNFAGAHRHPIICGHEFSGFVTKVAPDVAGFAVGDLVSVPPLLPCRKCDSCLEGHFSLCEDYDYFGSRRDGAYAEYVVVPADNALLMPAGVTPKAAAMIDPSAIALHAIRRTRLGKGSRVAVIGAGPIGLFAVQWARILGATEVLAVDLNEQKADMAREAGATMTATSEEQARERAGKGFDVVIESAGVPPTIALAVKLVARRGEASFIGIPHTPVELDKATFSSFLRREVSLHGSWNSFSSPFPGEEWTISAELMASGVLKTDFMITHELPLSEVPAIMKQLAERSIFSSKILFLPNGE